MAGVLASSSGVANDHKVHPEDGSRPDSPTDSSKPKKPDTLRNKVYQTCDDPSYSKLAKVISAIMMMVILISTMSFVLEAEVQIGGSLYEVRDDAEVRFIRTQKHTGALPARAPHLLPACAVSRSSNG